MSDGFSNLSKFEMSENGFMICSNVAYNNNFSSINIRKEKLYDNRETNRIVSSVKT